MYPVIFYTMYELLFLTDILRVFSVVVKKKDYKGMSWRSLFFSQIRRILSGVFSNDSESRSYLLKAPPPEFPPARQIRNPADKTGLKITLYQYQTCPFCCKVSFSCITSVEKSKQNLLLISIIGIWNPSPPPPRKHSLCRYRLMLGRNCKWVVLKYLVLWGCQLCAYRTC